MWNAILGVEAGYCVRALGGESVPHNELIHARKRGGHSNPPIGGRMLPQTS